MNVSQTILTRSAIADSRQDFYCPIFGEPRSFLQNKLSTYECVIRCCFEERYNLSLVTNNKNVSFPKVASTVVKQIKCLYDKASIPSLSDCQIVKIINVYHDSYIKIRKSYKRDKDKPLFKARLEDLKLKARSLFDVAACKCTMTVKCTCQNTTDAYQCAILIKCLCEKTNKIPVLELRFMFLQRNYNLGKIGSIDKTLTKKINVKTERKARDLQRAVSGKEVSKIGEYSEIDEHKHSSIKDWEYEEDEFKPSTSTEKHQWQMRIQLSAIINSDRFGVSDQTTAVIASSVLRDVGMITDTDSSYVVHKCKKRRDKSCVRTDFKSQFTPPEES
ncbi:hypothetical protein AVEN_194577-1 [Araneus ventricosus]|uniref:Uncharacterized protein n=1 Tax=Araneus ventricosus TaxID=182803 RepID=A0A4Y2A693_ARAVE|nr:hypothetical protein AVEN_194577-1 [Araneus ventricosus]